MKLLCSLKFTRWAVCTKILVANGRLLILQSADDAGSHVSLQATQWNRIHMWTDLTLTRTTRQLEACWRRYFKMTSAKQADIEHYCESSMIGISLPPYSPSSPSMTPSPFPLHPFFHSPAILPHSTQWADVICAWRHTNVSKFCQNLYKCFQFQLTTKAAFCRNRVPRSLMKPQNVFLVLLCAHICSGKFTNSSLMWCIFRIMSFRVEKSFVLSAKFTQV